MYKWVRTSVFIATLAVVVCASSLVAQETQEEKVELKVGDTAPDFTLKDQNGVEQTLSELTGDHKLAIVFVRSVNWWPFCKAQLVKLQGNIETVENAGIKVIGISYDSVEDIKAFADKREVKFPLLSDSDSAVIKAFGLLNEQARGKKAGIPHPTTIVIDSESKIISRLGGSVMKRHTAKQLLDSVSDDK